MSRRGWILFTSLALLWGTPYLFIRVAVEYVEPSVLVGLRVALAGLLLLPIALSRKELRPALKYWRWIVVFAFVEIAIPFLMLGYAEQRLSSSVTALVIAGVPILAAILARALGLDPNLRGMRIVGLAVGITGVATLVGLDVQGTQYFGVAAALITVTGYALGPIIITLRLSGAPSLGVITIALLINSVVYAPFVWLQWPSQPVAASAWWSIVALGVLCTAIAFVLLFALIAEVGPARTTVITFINPAVAVLLGVVILSEPITLGILVGFPLVILGSYLATRPDKNPAASIEDAPHA
ncbi:MAG: DMT family transporter [Actinomycetes bacterium]|nr:EamA family transporter [Candidatus Nanopelagicales bacterium]MDP4824922.1 EamA family transporter [Candidatus Nanopelagicales bacterium]MDP4887219.1 EamA family transporter [Candidatus Nanopelagicales bacterium]